MGIVCMFVGFTGSAFNKHVTTNIGLGETARFEAYRIKLLSVDHSEQPDYTVNQAALAVFKNGKQIATLQPEFRFYKSSQQQMSIVGIRRRPNEDLYVNYSGVLPDNSKAIFQLYLFPLVSWIWAGYYVLLFGTLICLIPSKVRLQYARTEVVGFATAPAAVQS
jgi:cytochrome c-type biogenesis protein CcmF